MTILKHEAVALMRRRLTKEQAIALDETGWWEGLPAETVALAQLQQELLCMPWGLFQEKVEEALGEAVTTFSFGVPGASQALIRAIQQRHSG